MAEKFAIVIEAESPMGRIVRYWLCRSETGRFFFESGWKDEIPKNIVTKDSWIETFDLISYAEAAREERRFLFSQLNAVSDFKIVQVEEIKRQVLVDVVDGYKVVADEGRDSGRL